MLSLKSNSMYEARGWVRWEWFTRVGERKGRRGREVWGCEYREMVMRVRNDRKSSAWVVSDWGRGSESLTRLIGRGDMGMAASCSFWNAD